MPDIGPSNHDFNAQNGMTREQWRDKWLGSGIGNISGLNDFLSQNGGQLLADNGTVMTPYGDVLDIGTAFRSGNGRPGWTQVDTSLPQAQGSNFGPSQQAFNNTQGMPFQQNPGAMPYNPYAPSGGVTGGIFRKPEAGMARPTGQTNGTLIGTNFSGAPSQNNPQPVSNKPMQMSSSVGGSSLGEPSFYRKQQTRTTAKPLPANNMGVQN